MTYLQKVANQPVILARDNGNRIELLIRISLSITVYYFLVAGYLMIANSWQLFLDGSENFYIVTTIVMSIILWLLKTNSR